MVPTMHKQLFVAFFSALLLLSLASIVSAQLPVGVKVGDWIQYEVTFTGTPPDPSHTLSAANMTVLSVDGTTIKINIVSTLINGTQTSTNSTLNLQTGQLIDNFIIPANLKVGDQFYDSNVGNITISGLEQKMYAAQTRTVVNATSGSNTYVWDQATGIDVEGFTMTTNYTMHTLANMTNIWHAQVPEFNFTVVNSLVIIGAASAVIAISVVAARKRK
jgi:hypothetical protein